MAGAVVWDSFLQYTILAVPAALFATLFFVLLLMIRRRRNVPLPSAQGVLTPATAPATAAKSEVPLPARRTVEQRIEAAQQSQDKALIAPLYLDLAKWHEHSGDEAARMAALRSAAGYGALHGPHSAHGAARLQLAEAAYEAGDLTSACEQWQLARTAYLADGQHELHDQVDKRMREHGCPIDWVLTDF